MGTGWSYARFRAGPDVKGNDEMVPYRVLIDIYPV